MDPSFVDALEKGVQFFNQGRYWEAHEAWEGPWKALSGKARVRLQGLIQACAVFHHLENNRVPPALSLARLSLEKLSQNDQGPVTVPGLVALLAALVKNLDRPVPAWKDELEMARRLRAALQRM